MNDTEAKMGEVVEEIDMNAEKSYGMWRLLYVDRADSCSA